MWFIIYHRVAVLVRVVDVNHRRSPLVQGGLEIPIEVSILMPHSDVYKHALETYATLISKESVNGRFADVAANILVGMASSTDESDTEKRKRY